MDAVVDAVDNILSLLPFNGDKTVIGLALHALLPLVTGYFPAAAVIAPAVSALADCLVGLGLFHKAVKAAQ